MVQVSVTSENPKLNVEVNIPIFPIFPAFEDCCGSGTCPNCPEK